jgi:hypothetical protein
MVASAPSAVSPARLLQLQIQEHLKDAYQTEYTRALCWLTGLRTTYPSSILSRNFCDTKKCLSTSRHKTYKWPWAEDLRASNIYIHCSQYFTTELLHQNCASSQLDYLKLCITTVHCSVEQNICWDRVCPSAALVCDAVTPINCHSWWAVVLPLSLQFILNTIDWWTMSRPDYHTWSMQLLHLVAFPGIICT